MICLSSLGVAPFDCLCSAQRHPVAMTISRVTMLARPVLTGLSQSV